MQQGLWYFDINLFAINPAILELISPGLSKNNSTLWSNKCFFSILSSKSVIPTSWAFVCRFLTLIAVLIAWSTNGSSSPSLCPLFVEGIFFEASNLSIDLKTICFSSKVPLLAIALTKGAM